MASRTTREIDVSIDDTQGGPLQKRGLTEIWLRTVVALALEAALPAGEPGGASLLITGDSTVQELNRQYRGLDEVTDVLSFSTTHPGLWEGEMPDAGLGDGQSPHSAQDHSSNVFLFPGDQAPPLGEVIISLPQAQRQAEHRHEPVERELALLIVHGVLHLVGHDHLEADEAARMQAKERAVLETVFSPGNG